MPRCVNPIGARALQLRQGLARGTATLAWFFDVFRSLPLLGRDELTGGTYLTPQDGNILVDVSRRSLNDVDT